MPATNEEHPINLLALETATDACSAALFVNGETRARFEVAPRRHTELIIRMIDELMADAGLTAAALDGIAFGIGLVVALMNKGKQPVSGNGAQYAPRALGRSFGVFESGDFPDR